MPPRRNRTAAVAQAVADLLPTLTARITDEIRQNENNGNNVNRSNARRVNTGGSGNDGDAQPTDIHIYEVLGYGDQFKARLATYKLEGDAHSWWRAYKQAKGGFLEAKVGTQEEQAKHFKWGLNDFVLDRILNTEFTNVAQVANTARNIEIFRDRSKNEGNNKRDRDGHHMVTETGMKVTEGVVIDREVTDRVMAVTDWVLVLRGRGITMISRFGANSMVVLMGHQAKVDTRIMPHIPYVTFVGNFIWERCVTRLLVLALNVERLGIWLKIVKKVVQAAGVIGTTSHMLRAMESLH
ncbi:hypothetical protein Tco_1479458 [Tanacetum coccineum]